MPLKILLLEDAPADAELVLRELKKGGIDFESKVICTEAGFLVALDNFKPDVILSDHSMPGFNSMEAMAICKARQYQGPFILVTGAVSEEFAVECLRSGADDYILKDKLTRLPAAVKSSVKKWEAERARQRAVKSLEEQNIFMNLLLKSIPVAQYVCRNASHEMTYMSNNIYAFSGYHPDQFMQDSKFWYNMIHPDDAEKVTEHFQGIKEHQECIMEYRWKVSDGTYRWIYDRAKIIKTDSGTPFIAGAMIDITLRKETEEKLLAKNKDLNTFIYRSTHDLRGPLMTILGLTNVALDEEEMNQLRSYIMMIDECTHKLDDVLLSLITTVSLVDADLEAKDVDIASMVEAVLFDCKAVDGFANINVVKDIEVGARLQMDAFVLNSILKNLIENAVKYSDFSMPDPTILISAKTDERYLYFSVKDNGIGISEKILDRVFEMFFRGTQVCKGSGLGLYIVKNAVEKLNGTVKLTSSGKGTLAEVKIPLPV
jgi:PAS domain S-box-containing protein